MSQNNDELQAEIEYLRKQLKSLHSEKKDLYNRLRAQKDIAYSSQKSLNAWEKSDVMRFAKKYYLFRDCLFPKKSKIRALARKIKKFVLGDGEIKKAKVMTKASKINNSKHGSGITWKQRDESLDLYPWENEILPKFKYDKILFHKYDKPIVSIIIPVYNQFNYTYNCLKSINKYDFGEVPFEIIIADDCSTDYTADLENIAENIVVIHNDKNLRFLLNCNNASQYAKGKYILFLNNDTQVTANWLSSLVDLIDSNEEIGMVGSKLVYPNGKLQEAGGILWKDGNAWNYGHNQDRERPEYNYVKEADYISGASIMIKADLWKEIGGFDETFVPAYYEDTDLAFEVRKHGYKVVYQPLSVVVHFEGISNGTNTSVGLKHYQLLNKERFYNKWKTVLDKEHFPNGEMVFKAKDRSGCKKHILVIDHYVPTYNMDAGSRFTWNYLKLFIEMGMKVTFIGDNFYRNEPYATELTQMGVEFLYGGYYKKNWKDWLKKNASMFDYAYLNRPHISEKYMDILREYSNCKIIYCGQDLHYLREFRQYEITGDKKHLDESNRYKKLEFELFNKADVIFAVGSYEQELIHKCFTNKIVRNVPIYLYDCLKDNVNKDFSARKGLLFVGGFGHAPNVDAVLWFAENVFPAIVEKIPDIVWYIVGNKPPEKIKSLASANIIVTGFVTDEELENIYNNCRMVVVPLRFGAGVKGKVLEAAYNQMPIVTTSVGVEGLSLDENAFKVVNDSLEMSKEIVSLYNDIASLEILSRNCKLFISKYFMVDCAKKMLSKDIKLQ